MYTCISKYVFLRLYLVIAFKREKNERERKGISGTKNWTWGIASFDWACSSLWQRRGKEWFNVPLQHISTSRYLWFPCILFPPPNLVSWPPPLCPAKFRNITLFKENWLSSLLKSVAGDTKLPCPLKMALGCNSLMPLKAKCEVPTLSRSGHQRA